MMACPPSYHPQGTNRGRTGRCCHTAAQEKQGDRQGQQTEPSKRAVQSIPASNLRKLASPLARSQRQNHFRDIDRYRYFRGACAVFGGRNQSTYILEPVLDFKFAIPNRLQSTQSSHDSPIADSSTRELPLASRGVLHPRNKPVVRKVQQVPTTKDSLFETVYSL